MDTFKFYDTSKTTQDESHGKVVYYHDRFFVGDITDHLIFSACITKSNSFDEKEMNLDIGVIGDGLSLNFNLADENQKREALQIVSKIAEGLNNLLSALKKECKDE
jgi:hypothetical protein